MLSRSLPLLFVVACVASAATTDTRNSPRFQPSQKAQERDGAHHGGGGSVGHSSGGGGHGHSSGGSSSYSAPTHSQPASSYSAGGGGGGHGGNDQGNLYYYYYPVEEYGNTEAADGGFDVFTAIILPLVILGGLLLALSSFSFNFTTGRSLGGDAPEGIVDQLQGEVERIFYLYLNAFESESCIKRTICESGVYAKEYKNKEFFMSMTEPFVPETMKGNMALFKMAAKDGFEVGKCKKYRCDAPKIFN